MQNCYNTGERIPREKMYDQDERLATKHIQTLQFVQEVVNENKTLKQRVQELEESQLHCDELHKQAEESQAKIKLVQEQSMKQADEKRVSYTVMSFTNRQRRVMGKIKLVQEQFMKRADETRVNSTVMSFTNRQRRESQLHCDELHKQAEESKTKIKLVQEQFMKRADEINAMMAEKHRDEMMKVVQEKLDQEQKYSEDMVKLKTEVSQLESTNTDLMARISELTGSQEQIEVLNTEIEDQKRIISDLQLELDGVCAENQQLSGEKTTQFSQLQGLQDLRAQNETLTQDLRAMAQKNHELGHKVSKLESDLREASVARDKIELIDNLKTKLGKLHKERAVFSEKEEYYQKQIGELRYEVERLNDNVQSADVTKDRVLEEYYKVSKELQYLKKNYAGDSDNKNFKEFVKLKREVAILKEENADLRKRTLEDSDRPSGFPMLKFHSAAPVPKISADRKSNRSKKSVSLQSNA